MNNTFKIELIVVTFGDQPPMTINLGIEEENSDYYHTLLIGKNGVCKSSFLRAIIDFFLRAQSRSLYVKWKGFVDISRIDYIVGRDRFSIIGDSSYVSYCKNMESCDFAEMKFPLIVASTMSMFDKFPINVISKSINSRYSIDKYRYIGPKANHNMFMSKTNVLLQPLSLIGKTTACDKIQAIGQLLDYIGFQKVITIDASLYKSSSKEYVSPYEATSDSEELLLDLFEIGSPSHTFDIRFDVNDKLEQIGYLADIISLKDKRRLVNIHCYCYTHCGKKVDINELSSGEFNLLALMINIILLGNERPLLLLFDEPEISQHPNWQIDIIKMLEDILENCSCHIITATHSHFLVSNLPMRKSSVIRLIKDENEAFFSETVDSDTYGWSSEEVLLKVFNMATDRSRYLAQIVGELLQAIGNNNISLKEVKTKLAFLQDVSTNLSDIDPMKKVITSIVSEFNS